MFFAILTPLGPIGHLCKTLLILMFLTPRATKQLPFWVLFLGSVPGPHFWTLLGVILEYFWGSFGSPIGVLGVPVGNLGDPLAPPGDPLGALWHPWGSHVASLGALWPFFGTLGGAWRVHGHPQETF